MNLFKYSVAEQYQSTQDTHNNRVTIISALQPLVLTQDTRVGLDERSGPLWPRARIQARTQPGVTASVPRHRHTFLPISS
jgi:hypothetical protein